MFFEVFFKAKKVSHSPKVEKKVRGKNRNYIEKNFGKCFPKFSK
jgi:hypothetical protein